MSSPHLNNLIIIGCMLTYSSVIFLGLDSQLSSVAAFPYICTARAWLLMAGFSLAFGSMFSKTWRVHSIFTDVKLNKKVTFPASRMQMIFAFDRHVCMCVCMCDSGDKRLPVVHGGRDIVSCRSHNHDDVADSRSVLSGDQANGALRE